MDNQVDNRLSQRVVLTDQAGTVVPMTGGFIPTGAPIGPGNLSSTFPGLNATATTVFVARATRVKATVVNYGSAIAYLGTSTVTSSTGNRLDPGASRVYFYTGLLQGITASGATTNLDVQDEY